MAEVGWRKDHGRRWAQDPRGQAVGRVKSIGIAITRNSIRSDTGGGDSDPGAKISSKQLSVAWRGGQGGVGVGEWSGGNGGERGGHGAVRWGVGDPLGERRPWGMDRVLLQFGGEGDVHSELEGLGDLADG